MSDFQSETFAPARAFLGNSWPTGSARPQGGEEVLGRSPTDNGEQ
jgi:hypothetical protein